VGEAARVRGARAFAVAAVAMALFAPAPARAQQTQSAATTEKARAVFAEALKEENAGHYDAALDKYRVVLTMKDTPAVRYRIAMCLEAQNKLRDARDAFASVHAPGHLIAQEAEAEIKKLEPRIPDLTVTLTGPAASSCAVTIDGQTWAPGHAVQLNPGEHLVVVSGAGVKKNQSVVSLPESTHRAITLQADLEGGPTADRPPVPAAPPPPSSPSSPSSPLPPPDHSKTYGIIGLAVGGAMLGGSLVVTLLENGQVSTIQAETAQCPSSPKSSTRRAPRAPSTPRRSCSSPPASWRPAWAHISSSSQLRRRGSPWHRRQRAA
jgi:hypothetical protein